jgi:hypothetical protein
MSTELVSTNHPGPPKEANRMFNNPKDRGLAPALPPTVDVVPPNAPVVAAGPAAIVGGVGVIPARADVIRPNGDFVGSDGSPLTIATDGDGEITGATGTGHDGVVRRFAVDRSAGRIGQRPWATSSFTFYENQQSYFYVSTSLISNGDFILAAKLSVSNGASMLDPKAQRVQYDFEFFSEIVTVVWNPEAGGFHERAYPLALENDSALCLSASAQSEKDTNVMSALVRALRCTTQWRMAGPKFTQPIPIDVRVLAATNFGGEVTSLSTPCAS